MEHVQDFCTSNAFEAEFESFAKEHSEVFMKFLDYTEKSEEHPLEFHDIYRQYLKKFEGLIEDFIEKVGVEDFTNNSFVFPFRLSSCFSVLIATSALPCPSCSFLLFVNFG